MLPCTLRLRCASPGMSLGFPRGAGERAEAGAAGASPALSLLCGCSDSVFNYTAAGGSVPVPARRCAGKVGSFASCSCKAPLGGGDGVSRGSLHGFPISRGVFGEPGRSGACLSSSVMCQGSVREANPSTAKQLLDALLCPRGKCHNRECWVPLWALPVPPTSGSVPSSASCSPSQPRGPCPAPHLW